MMFALGLVTGVLGTFALFVFAMWKQRSIQSLVETVEETFGETGGFVEGVDPEVKTRRELEDLLREK